MDAEARPPRPLALVAALVAVGALLCAVLVALGAWQVQRLAWKEALIARVERNMTGAPVPAPGPARWGALARDDDYRRLRVRGRFDHEREVLVRATTALGAGHWVLTPLRTEAGWWLLVNRGFVPPGQRSLLARPDGVRDVVGLLRGTEPGGGFLQANDPAAGRWTSRDVAVIAAAQRLQGAVAPYFVDAQASADADPGAWPRPGLTVVQFHNNHLVYALTWFCLAAALAAALGYLAWDARRLRRQPGAAALAEHPER